MTNEESVKVAEKFFKDIYEILTCKYSVVDRCAMASQLPPDQWIPEVLWPFYTAKGISEHSIFGRSQIAMGREHSMKLLDALVETELCSSLGEARKGIRNNAVKVNRKPIKDIDRVLTKDDVLPNIDAIVLEFGKYNFGIIEMCDP